MTDQRSQKVEGNQINISSDANIEQVGDRIELQQGDYVAGNKVVNIYQPPRKEPKPRLPFEPQLTHVPAGQFVMGYDNQKAAAPRHLVDLPQFFIAITPITNAQYAHFVWQTNRVVHKEQLWQGNRPADDRLNHPVMGVTWYDALAYCEWLQQETERPYSLPTEAQWERAARGTNGRLYPWGNEWIEGRCNSSLAEKTAVAAYPAQTVAGIFDLIGNVREWTLSLWGTQANQPDPRYRYPWQDDGRNDLHASAAVRRVVRGGRGKRTEAYRCFMRSSYPPNQVGRKNDRLGFRVVLSINNERPHAT